MVVLVLEGFVDAEDVFDDVVVVGIVELELELEPPVLPVVEPMSPQRMLEKTTCVPGFWAMMLAGFPSVLLQGPELPLSSQFMYWLLSFQMLKMRTMP